MKKKKNGARPTLFSKARVANVMSALVILYGLHAFIYGLIPDGNTEVVAGLMGFAAKHLWDSCREDMKNGREA